jgi:transcriptional regulator with XRE-family HTH domain
MHTIAQSLGKNVCRLRTQRGWTQEFFSEKCGISCRYLLFIEAGQRLPTLEVVAKMRDSLEASWDDLLKKI